MRVLASIIMIGLLLTGAVCAQTWQVVYDASTGVLPTQAPQAWHLYAYGAPISIADGTLHIGNTGGATYRREEAAIGVSVPVTLEARVCLSSTGSGGASLGIGTYGCQISPAIYGDRLVANDRDYQAHIFYLDFTTPHTLRVAYDGVSQACLWVDGKPAMSWAAAPWAPSTGTPGGISFSSGRCDSYWQYVAYSKEFLPLPEPSSLLALLAGLGGLGGLIWRRRR